MTYVELHECPECDGYGIIECEHGAEVDCLVCQGIGTLDAHGVPTKRPPAAFILEHSYKWRVTEVPQ